jgi:hypothetical protein
MAEFGGQTFQGPGSAGVSLDSRQFEQVLRHLTDLTGKSLSKVVKAEAASILGKALQKTGVSTASRVKARYTYTERGQNKKTIPFVRLNGRKRRVRSIKRKGKWVQRKNGRVWDPDLLNPEWKQLQAELKRLHLRARGRKGLAKATWLRIAKGAKLPALKPKPPAYVLKALGTFTQRLKAKTQGREMIMGGKKVYFIQVRNYSTTAMAPKSKKGPGGYGEFKKAMRGRVDHFNYSLAKGTFDSVGKIAKKYPGIYLTAPTR